MDKTAHKQQAIILFGPEATTSARRPARIHCLRRCHETNKGASYSSMLVIRSTWSIRYIFAPWSFTERVDCLHIWALHMHALFSKCSVCGCTWWTHIGHFWLNWWADCMLSVPKTLEQPYASVYECAWPVVLDLRLLHSPSARHGKARNIITYSWLGLFVCRICEYARERTPVVACRLMIRCGPQSSSAIISHNARRSIRHANSKENEARSRDMQGLQMWQTLLI